MAIERHISRDIKHSEEYKKVRHKTMGTYQYVFGLAGIWLTPILVFDVLSGFGISGVLKDKFKKAKSQRKEVFSKNLKKIRQEYPGWQSCPPPGGVVVAFLNARSR
jgi:hypothetical protein